MNIEKVKLAPGVRPAKWPVLQNARTLQNIAAAKAVQLPEFAELLFQVGYNRAFFKSRHRLLELFGPKKVGEPSTWKTPYPDAEKRLYDLAHFGFRKCGAPPELGA